MPKDGPCIAVSWATSYEDCTAAFYNADLELVATWREPLAGGDKVMCLTAGDLDGDGENEILLTIRMQPIWTADVTPNGLGGNNCYEALYHKNGHPDGGPAIAVNTERESPEETRNGSILTLDMNGKELWRYKYTLDDERGDACGFADMTGDGVPEIVSRYSRVLKEPKETGVLILSNRGKLLAKIPDIAASSAGPYVFRPKGPGTTPVYLSATTKVYEIDLRAK